jgi:hypothetical protein
MRLCSLQKIRFVNNKYILYILLCVKLFILSSAKPYVSNIVLSFNSILLQISLIEKGSKVLPDDLKKFALFINKDMTREFTSSIFLKKPIDFGPHIMFRERVGMLLIGLAKMYDSIMLTDDELKTAADNVLEALAASNEEKVNLFATSLKEGINAKQSFNMLDYIKHVIDPNGVLEEVITNKPEDKLGPHDEGFTFSDAYDWMYEKTTLIDLQFDHNFAEKVLELVTKVKECEGTQVEVFLIKNIEDVNSRVISLLMKSANFFKSSGRTLDPFSISEICNNIELKLNTILET